VQDVSVQSTFTWYGKQQPKKYDYQGNPVTGSAKTKSARTASLA
jgi:ferric enterobactin receptor